MNNFTKLLLSICFILPMQSNAQQDMGNSHTAMVYVCWHLANVSGYESDSDLFSKMISIIRDMAKLNTEKHFEFMAYAAEQVHEMDHVERNAIYKHGCLEPLKNIKRAERQGMLN